jgi:MFS transporter, SP family, sugar:H+ symporter
MKKPSPFGSVILPTCVAALGGFLFGFDSGVINGTVGALTEAFGSSGAVTGFNVASMLLGCAAGAFLAGRLSDAIGRRASLLAAAVLFAVSAWGSGIAAGSFEFVIYRVLGGLAVGAASVICPAYIAEISPAAVRGRLGTLQQLAIVLGLFAAFLSNFLIASVAGGSGAAWWLGYQAWQWMFWVELVPVAAFFAGLLGIPESPRYLVAAGRRADATRVLARLVPGGDAEAEAAEIARSLDSGHRPVFRDLWDSRLCRLHPIVWVGIALAALQQLGGINVVFYYGEVLWRAAGFSQEDALKINVIGGAINITATLIAIRLVDRVGRKPLLIWGSLGMTAMLGIMAGIFATARTADGGALALGDTGGLAALVSANLYIFCFCVTWGPVTWVLLGEMFPNQLRGAALSLAGLALWTANFGITITFPMLLSGVGLGGAYGIYTLFAALSGFFAWRFIHETKGITLERMTAD